MAGANRSPQIVRFGIFEADLRSGELRKNGTKVKLQQQPLQILLALLARPGEVVTREELRQQLWPADTFVDFEHSLNAAIKRLRDSLGESAEAPVYIETLPRRGYRFLAPVQGTCGEITNDQPPPGSLKTTRSRLIPYFVVALLLAVLTIAWIYRARASGHLFALSVLGSSPPRTATALFFRLTAPGA